MKVVEEPWMHFGVLLSYIVKIVSFRWVSNYQWKAECAVSYYTVSFNVHGL